MQECLGKAAVYRRAVLVFPAGQIPEHKTQRIGFMPLERQAFHELAAHLLECSSDLALMIGAGFHTLLRFTLGLLFGVIVLRSFFVQLDIAVLDDVSVCRIFPALHLVDLG